MKLVKKAGATSEIWQIWIADSSSTTGAGLTGLAFNTSSLTAYYHRDTDTTATAITLVTMTVGTFTSSGFKEIDATNMPGWYQFCPPNAALASGAKSCAFHLKGATNMAPLPIEVQLQAVDVDSATAFVTSVASVVGAVGSVTGSVGGNVVGSVASVTARVTANTDQLAGQTVSAGAGVTFPSSVASPTNITAGTITTTTNLTNLPSIPNNWLTAAGIAASALNGKGDWNIGKTGYALSSAGIQAIWDALTSALTTASSIGKLLVDNINATISSRSTYAGGAVASVTGNVGGNVVGSVGSVTGAVGSVTGNVGGNVTGSVGSIASGGITTASFGAGALDAAALATDASTEIANAVGALVIEGTTTLIQSQRLHNSVLGGKASGLDTSTAVFRDIGDTKARVTATTDANGNRTAVTTDLT